MLGDGCDTWVTPYSSVRSAIITLSETERCHLGLYTTSTTRVLLVGWKLYYTNAPQWGGTFNQGALRARWLSFFRQWSQVRGHRWGEAASLPDAATAMKCRWVFESCSWHLYSMWRGQSQHNSIWEPGCLTRSVSSYTSTSPFLCLQRLAWNVTSCCGATSVWDLNPAVRESVCVWMMDGFTTWWLGPSN